MMGIRGSFFVVEFSYKKYGKEVQGRNHSIQMRIFPGPTVCDVSIILLGMASTAFSVPEDSVPIIYLSYKEMMAFGNGVAFVGQIIKKALSSSRKTGHKELKSPPSIRLMPAKAKKPGDSG